MSKAIQVYDDGKLVDIPEDEVENVRCMRQVYKLIHQAWESVVNEDKISNPNFLSGVLKWLDKFIEHDLQRDEKTWEEVGKIWKHVQPNISKAMHEAQDEEDEEIAQRKFQKPFDKLSYAEKKILYDGEPSRAIVRTTLTYLFICRAFDTWTPNYHRVDDIAIKIQNAEVAKDEKEKAETEKRVPLGS